MRLSRLTVSAVTLAWVLLGSGMTGAQEAKTPTPAPATPTAGHPGNPGGITATMHHGAPGSGKTTGPQQAPLTPEEIERAYRLHTEGGQYLTKKDYRKAVARLGEALKVNPDLRDAWFDLALSYTYAREWKFSEYCIARVKKMGGDTNFLEAELKKARPPEKPQPKQEKSKGLEPGNVFGIIVPRKPPTESQQAVAVQYQTGGGRYLETKQYALAVDQYKQALAINPGLTDCWSDFALALTYSGQYDLAQAAIDELKKLGGDATFATAELAKAKPQGPGVSANGNVAPPGMK